MRRFWLLIAALLTALVGYRLLSEHAKGPIPAETTRSVAVEQTRSIAAPAATAPAGVVASPDVVPRRDPARDPAPGVAGLPATPTSAPDADARLVAYARARGRNERLDLLRKLAADADPRRALEGVMAAIALTSVHDQDLLREASYIYSRLARNRPDLMADAVHALRSTSSDGARIVLGIVLSRERPPGSGEAYLIAFAASESVEARFILLANVGNLRDRSSALGLCAEVLGLRGGSPDERLRKTALGTIGAVAAHDPGGTDAAVELFFEAARASWLDVDLGLEVLLQLQRAAPDRAGEWLDVVGRENPALARQLGAAWDARPTGGAGTPPR